MEEKLREEIDELHRENEALRAENESLQQQAQQSAAIAAALASHALRTMDIEFRPPSSIIREISKSSDDTMMLSAATTDA